MLSRATLRLPATSLLAACLILGSLATTAESDVVIRTELPVTTLVADGTSVYTMNVRGNTLQHPGTMFNGSEWDVVIPADITIIDAQIPDPAHPGGPSTNPNDFYFSQPPSFNGLMEPGLNYVDQRTYPFIGGGELDDNRRIVLNIFTGPSDSDDQILGIYWFTVNQGSTPGTGNFDINGVEILDTNFNIYRTPDLGGNGIQVQNDTFTVVAPQIPGDINNDGVVNPTDIAVFTDVLLGVDTAPEHLSRSEFDGTAPVNGLDIQGFVEAYLASA